MKKILIAYLFTITNAFAVPPTFFNGELQTNTYIQNIKTPNYQTTPLGGINRRIETGYMNELQNPNLEHSTVDFGWTVANATPSAGTTNMIEGKKALSLSLSGALSLSQVSTINAAQKSGVQMVASIFVKSDDVSDLQLCSLKNGAEDKCTAVGGYVQGSGWRQLTVSFLGDATSNGLKLKSTDTTGTVLVDQAFVGISDPLVDFNPDMVFSALISATGVVSQENVDWINGNGSGLNPLTLTFNSGYFSVAPNCVATSSGRIVSINSTTATSVQYNLLTIGGASGVDQPVYLVCEKQGVDYKSSKAYVASGSKLLNTTVFSAEVSSTGVVSNENVDWINGNCTNASPAVCTYNTSIFTVAPNCTMTPNSNTVDMGSFNAFSSTGFSVQFNLNNKYVFRVVCVKQGADYEAAFNPVIVGSFQDVNYTTGTATGRVETFTVAYGTTNVSTVCSGTPCFIQQIGNLVSSITRSGTGGYTLNTVNTYSGLICSLTPIQNTANAVAIRAAPLACTNCNSLSFTTGVQGSANFDTSGTLFCQGTR